MNPNEEKKDNRRPLAYCRVSTAFQASGLAAQVRQVREYCKANGIEGIQIFTDENQSGAKSSRPGLDRMMEEVRSGKVSMVIVPAFSRLARSTTHLLHSLDEFKKYDCSFISLSERLDTNTAAGKMTFTCLAAVSQLERELIAERVRIGLANARANGKIIGRKKTRPSELIRKLRSAGFTYRKISTISKCSHGAIAAEIREMKKEEMKKFAKELSPDVERKFPETQTSDSTSSTEDQKSKTEIKYW